MNLKTVAAAALAGAFVTSANVGLANEGPHVAPIKAYVEANVMSWLSDPTVIAAIQEQNERHTGMSTDQINELDQAWRAQTEGGDRPLIDEVLGNELSAFLADRKNESSGMITEVFVMDNVGLNVGQSDVTSDYWQGDEAKWQQTYEVGAGAIFVDEIETDESTQTLQSQVSIAITDESGAAIGAVTLGINVSAL
jgi:hypothetical protein